MGNYFEEKSGVLLDVDRAVDLITWLRSKTLLLALIRNRYAENNEGRTKSVLRAVLTRWTSHYMAFHRLLELRTTIQGIMYEELAKRPEKQMILVGDKKARTRSTQMIAIIQDSLFWHSITRYVNRISSN